MPSKHSLSNEEKLRKRATLDNVTKAKLDDSFTLGNQKSPEEFYGGERDDGFDVGNPQDFDAGVSVQYEDDVETSASIPKTDIIDVVGKPLIQHYMTGMLTSAEVLLYQGEYMHMAKVIKQAINDDSKLIGTFSDNSILNSMVYDVELLDGTIKQYNVNMIAEHIIYQVDSDCQHSQVLEGITDYKKDDSALMKDNTSVVSKEGHYSLRQTNIGWKFKVQWKYCTKQQWIPIKVMKTPNPNEIAEFVTARDIADEPAFSCWVTFILKKRNSIIADINSRVAKSTHKYGTAIPPSIKSCQKNGPREWQHLLTRCTWQ